MNRPVLLVVGTRPEGIKMIPVYKALKQLSIPVYLMSTTQHSELLKDVFATFGVEPDAHLEVMKKNQDLFHVSTGVLNKAKEIFNKTNPCCVLVQGDTTSTFAAALAAFYLKIPVAHVEAGLRTKDVYNPFPEELNRRIVSLIAQLHFTPTHHATENLLQEGYNASSIIQTGNTVVDALLFMKKNIELGSLIPNETLQKKIAAYKQEGKKIILLTAHRRESFEQGIPAILSAVKTVLQQERNLIFFYPFHPNPTIKKIIHDEGIDREPQVLLLEPLNYTDLIYLLLNADWIATDSGGICEEAVSLGKHVLILRDCTERMEAVKEGCAQLVGTEKEAIVRAMLNANNHKSIQPKAKIYGNGDAANIIASTIKKYFFENSVKEPKKGSENRDIKGITI